jgi:molecular chaperone GrpE
VHDFLDESKPMTAERNPTDEHGRTSDEGRTSGSEEVEASETHFDEAHFAEAGEAEPLESLRAEMDALHDRHLRLAAEFDNYRKRIDRERAELRTHAQAELVKGLLEILDDLQRFGEYDPETTAAASLLEGVGMVEKKLRRALETAGLEPVDAEGEFFNPSTMEALMTVPAEQEEEDEMVADVFQRGYRFRHLLIRPAKVRVKKYD